MESATALSDMDTLGEWITERLRDYILSITRRIGGVVHGSIE